MVVWNYCYLVLVDPCRHLIHTLFQLDNSHGYRIWHNFCSAVERLIVVGEREMIRSLAEGVQEQE